MLTRKYDGKIFHYQGWFDRKVEANKKAGDIRKHGGLARVQTTKNEFGTFYHVWSRNK